MVAAQVIAEVHRTVQILALAFGAEQLSPVTGIDCIEGSVITNGEPAVVTAGIDDDTEHGIVVDISIAVLELLRACSVGTPAAGSANHVVGRRDLHLEERCERYTLLCVVVLAGLTDDSL